MQMVGVFQGLVLKYALGKILPDIGTLGYRYYRKFCAGFIFFPTCNVFPWRKQLPRENCGVPGFQHIRAQAHDEVIVRSSSA
jgi:hypothetical protein